MRAEEIVDHIKALDTMVGSLQGISPEACEALVTRQLTKLITKIEKCGEIDDVHLAASLATLETSRLSQGAKIGLQKAIIASQASIPEAGDGKFRNFETLFNFVQT